MKGSLSRSSSVDWDIHTMTEQHRRDIINLENFAPTHFNEYCKQVNLNMCIVTAKQEPQLKNKITKSRQKYIQNFSPTYFNGYCKHMNLKICVILIIKDYCHHRIFIEGLK